MPRLKVTFLDDKDQEHCLSFKISNSNLALRWQELVVENKKSNRNIHTVLMNTTYKQLPRIHDELQSVVAYLNSVYDQTLPEYSDKTLSRTQLNILHEQFEVYGDRIPELQEKGIIDTDVHSNKMHLEFCRLNELIHSYEDALANQPSNWPRMGALIDFYPTGIYSPLLERDRLYLESDFKWGGLYLGYNTLGKDWSSVWGDNDLDVIARDQVRPQQRFAAENWLYFGQDWTDFERIESFEKWYEQLPNELRNKVPVDSVNQLSFGRLHIGDIMIDDYFLKYDRNLNNWKIPNSYAKLYWSNEVFSTFIKVVNFDIYE